MKRQNFSDEFKEQVIKECRQIGNIALIARRHELSPSTVYTGLEKQKKWFSYPTPQRS